MRDAGSLDTRIRAHQLPRAAYRSQRNSARRAKAGRWDGCSDPARLRAIEAVPPAPVPADTVSYAPGYAPDDAWAPAAIEHDAIEAAHTAADTHRAKLDAKNAAARARRRLDAAK